MTSTKLDKVRSGLTNNLQQHLSELIPLEHYIGQVYKYAVFPTGKMIRPLLVKAVISDFSSELIHDSFYINLGPDSNHAYLASAIELHHAYTLVHDDLPCMDNDTIRRGKATTHLIYGEWAALLVGDGLLNLSYQLLSKIRAECLGDLIRFISWGVGPKGLIQGQVMDLSFADQKRD